MVFHRPQDEIQRNSFKVNITAVREFRICRHKIVRATQLHAVPGIINECHIGIAGLLSKLL